MPHFVYLIGPELGDIKVGYSGNPHRRLKQLQTGHPERLLIHYAKEFPTESAGRLVEGQVQKRLAGFRREGEWFDISVDATRNLIDQLGEAHRSEEELRAECAELDERAEVLRMAGTSITAEMADVRARLDQLNILFMENLKAASEISERLRLLDPPKL